MVVETYFSSSRWEIHRPTIVDMIKPELVGAFKNSETWVLLVSSPEMGIEHACCILDLPMLGFNGMVKI